MSRQCITEEEIRRLREAPVSKRTS
uniref:Uncharacterized protein n=1 Tax=Anguilla anguilla TaxID=7936 RepID=A0A0E9U7K8_ANGAN